MSAKRKASSGAKFAPPTVKSAIKVPAKATIDESRTAVAGTDTVQSSLKQGADTIDISSDSESDSEVDDDEEKADSDEAMNGVETEAHSTTTIANNQSKASKSRTNRISSKINGSLPSPDETPQVPATVGDSAEEDDEATSPTFGELLRGTIDVPALLSTQASSTTTRNGASTSGATKQLEPHALSRTTPLDPPSLSSLSTVLSQALRTEDAELLESCLEVTNLDSIQRTVERLDPVLAGVLLSKLAARFHRRPGRAGSLMVWVKWTLVAHGGALAVQPRVLERLVSLQKVLGERSKGLPSLLALKGKLDMLDAQMQLRHGRQRQRRRGGGGNGGDDDSEEEESEDEADDEDGAIYVEGEVDHEAPAGALANRVDVDDDAEVPLTVNGLVADSDVDDDEDDLDEVDDSDADDDVDDALDEDEVDHDDVEDSVSDDDSDAEAAPPTKVQKTTRGFGKRH